MKKLVNGKSSILITSAASDDFILEVFEEYFREVDDIVVESIFLTPQPNKDYRVLSLNFYGEYYGKLTDELNGFEKHLKNKLAETDTVLVGETTLLESGIRPFVSC